MPFNPKSPPYTSGSKLTAAEFNRTQNALQSTTALAEAALTLAETASVGVIILDTAHPSLAAALDATPVGGTLEIRGNYTQASTFTVNKSVTLHGGGGSITTTSASAYGVTVTANNVTIDGLTIVGTGSGTISTGRGISAVGTISSPISGLTIVNCDISAVSQYGVYLRHCMNFTMVKNDIHSIAYAGVIMLSCIDGDVSKNTITDMVMPSGTLAYGIAMTRDRLTDIVTVSPRTRGVLCSDNVVTDVPWEGINTHGGQDLIVTRNRVNHCKVGISIVGCPNTVGDDTYGPLNVTVSNNTVDSKVTDGSLGNGIQFVGGGTVVGTVTEYGTGIISGNTVVGHSLAAGTTGNGGINAYKTKGLIVAGNRVIEPGTTGIAAYFDNQQMTISDNTVQDVWNTSGNATAVNVSSINNTVTVSGTRIVTGTKSAAVINSRGLNISQSADASVSVSDGGGNNWGAATSVPIQGSTRTITQLGTFATTARPTAIVADSGGMVFDQTLNKPIWSDGTAWRDATGTVV